MINASLITKQIKEWFEDDPNLTGHKITRAEYVNEDAGLARDGWIGVYRRFIDYDPRNLGKATGNYEGDFTIDIIVQRSSLLSGEDSEDVLESSVKSVLDRLIQLPKTYIDHFSEITVEYTYIETDRTSLYFQGALITAIAEFSIEVG